MYKQFLNILYNKKYSKNTLYGGGIFPFWIYSKYFGRPVYKKARKAGINVYFSIMCANILGSLFHVHSFKNMELELVLYFILSLLIFTSIFYAIHKSYRKMNRL